MQEHEDEPPAAPTGRPAAYAQWEHATPHARRRPTQRTIVLAVAAAAIIAIAHRPSTGNNAASTSDAQSTSQGTVTDLLQFDQSGDPACAMHYSQNSDGKTVTRFTISQTGELIAHVSSPDGPHRNDQQVTANSWAFTYDVPLNQVTDMGAVLQYADGSRAACSIGPGADAP